MSPIFLASLFIPLAFIVFVVASQRLTGGAALTVRLIASTLAMPMLAFFVFGFLTSFEPVAMAMVFRVGYVLLFVSVITGLVFTWLPNKRLSKGNG